jgi:hypothetical protein
LLFVNIYPSNFSSTSLHYLVVNNLTPNVHSGHIQEIFHQYGKVYSVREIDNEEKFQLDADLDGRFGGRGQRGWRGPRGGGFGRGRGRGGGWGGAVLNPSPTKAYQLAFRSRREADEAIREMNEVDYNLLMLLNIIH